MRGCSCDVVSGSSGGDGVMGGCRVGIMVVVPLNKMSNIGPTGFLQGHRLR